MRGTVRKLNTAGRKAWGGDGEDLEENRAK